MTCTSRIQCFIPGPSTYDADITLFAVWEQKYQLCLEKIPGNKNSVDMLTKDVYVGNQGCAMPQLSSKVNVEEVMRLGEL